jgi:aminoglycoside phosphotransferase (APT) family kinase protein
VSDGQTLLHALSPLLPEAVLGAVHAVTPISLGLSGAGVYAVDAARGAFILRIQGAAHDDARWHQQLLVLRRAATQGIAPAVVHVDEAARAVVSARVAGVPLPAALGDPSQRGAAISGVVQQLRALHALDASGVEERDAVVYARETFAAQQGRRGFPVWALPLTHTIDRVAEMLAADTRRVLSHNDVNPGNVLWDGTRAWLVDWEVAGLAHPFYDFAALATFLMFDDATANALLALQEQTQLMDADHEMLAVLRKLAALLLGCTFLGMVPSLEAHVPPTRDDALPLPDVYARLRSGALALQSPEGQAAFGLALLRIATEPS